MQGNLLKLKSWCRSSWSVHSRRWYSGCREPFWVLAAVNCNRFNCLLNCSVDGGNSLPVEDDRPTPSMEVISLIVDESEAEHTQYTAR